MCQAAIIWAGIGLVVYGADTPFLAALGFDTFDLTAREVEARARFDRCEIIGGVLRAECEALFLAWVQEHPRSPA